MPLRLVVILVIALTARETGGAAPNHLCGGRSISVPLLGTYSFSVSAVYKQEQFAFRCVRPYYLPSMACGAHVARFIVGGGMMSAQDGDLHVAGCAGSWVDRSTGKVTQAAPCLVELLDRYSLTGLSMDLTNLPQKVMLSATAAPLGYSLGTVSLELSQAACAAPPSSPGKDEL
jgi:hypothetical protein